MERTVKKLERSMETRNVLITGASGGLGRAIVSELAGDGWMVHAGVREPAADRGLENGSGVRPIPLDVTDDSSIARCIESVSASSGGRLDAVVNNAGINADGPLEVLPRDSLRHLFEVNVVGAAAVTAACLPMLRSTQGHVVNIGGAAGRSPLPYFGALSASKAALDSLSSAWRMELRDQRVSVTLIECGAIDTPFFRRGHSGSTPRTTRAPAHGLYDDAASAARAAVLSSPQDSPADVARIVARILARPRPPARVVVGRQARWVLPVLRLLPTDLQERVLLRSLGISDRR